MDGHRHPRRDSLTFKPNSERFTVPRKEKSLQPHFNSQVKILYKLKHAACEQNPQQNIIHIVHVCEYMKSPLVTSPFLYTEPSLKQFIVTLSNRHLKEAKMKQAQSLQTQHFLEGWSFPSPTPRSSWDVWQQQDRSLHG